MADWRAGRQGGADRPAGEARAWENFGKTATALRLWTLLAEQHPDSPEGRKAHEQVQRLEKVRGTTPYLGISFAGETAIVEKVLPGGPATRVAAYEVGDRVRTLGGKKVGNLTGLRRALEGVKPGDKVKLEVDRQGTRLTLTVAVGAPPK